MKKMKNTNRIFVYRKCQFGFCSISHAFDLEINIKKWLIFMICGQNKKSDFQ